MCNELYDNKKSRFSAKWWITGVPRNIPFVFALLISFFFTASGTFTLNRYTAFSRYNHN